MLRSIASPALACLALLLAATAGCGGDRGLFHDAPLVADSVMVTRRGPGVVGGAADPAEPQRLQLDLTTGRGSVTNPDGRVYPVQVETADLNELREGIASRSWQVGRREAAKGVSDPTGYTLTAYNAHTPVARPVVWYVPSKNPLPPVLGLVEAIFNRADRQANPVSERVNLLE